MVPDTSKVPLAGNSTLSAAPLTLQDVHDALGDRRRKADLRRLESLLNEPLERMPGGSIDWFDDRFPPAFMAAGAASGRHEGVWSSPHAYRRWRRSVRNSIKRIGSRNATQSSHSRPVLPRQVTADLEHTTGWPLAEQLMCHADASARAVDAGFGTVSPAPKSRWRRRMSISRTGDRPFPSTR